jgi:ABC-type uncharacterized transport system permease subunit
VIGVVRLLYALKAVWAVLAALLLGSALIAFAGTNPIHAYTALFQGAFLDYYGFADTLVKMSPLILSALAVTVPMRAGLFNIGSEGQIYLGALLGTAVALYLPGTPAPLHVAFALVAGMIGGGVWALLPALLKAYHGVNELVVSLLSNYLAINLVGYLLNGPMMAAEAPYPYSDEIPERLQLPHILPGTDVHAGVIATLGIAAALFVVFRHTSYGFAIKTVGRSPLAAQYAGISIRRHVLGSFFLGGALAGLAGMFEVLGLKYRLFHLFAAGYGFDGVIVMLLAAANPLLVVLAALFFGGLRSGAGIMQRAVGVDATVIEAIEGLVIVIVATSFAFRFQRSRWAKVLAERQTTKALLARMPEGD